MKGICSILFVLFSGSLISQPLRLHLMGGFANYSGDLQSKNFTLGQARGVITAGATFHLTDRFALRSEYSFAHVTADDKLNSNTASRNLHFQSWIKEFNLMGEYDILNTLDRKFTPYVFGGVGVFRFSPYTRNSAGDKVYLHPLRTEGQETSAYPDRKHYKKTQCNIPVGGGLKYILSDNVYVAAELGYRKLFTDYLDDVSATYADEAILRSEVGPSSVAYAFRGDELSHDPRPYPAAGSPRGSTKYKDSYYFGQVRVSFRLNWFDGGYGPGKKNKMGCPGVRW